MTIVEVVALVRQKGGGFRSPGSHNPKFTWTIEKTWPGLIGGGEPQHTTKVAFQPTARELLLTDWEWVPLATMAGS